MSTRGGGEGKNQRKRVRRRSNDRLTSKWHRYIWNRRGKCVSSSALHVYLLLSMFSSIVSTGGSSLASGSDKKMQCVDGHIFFLRACGFFVDVLTKFTMLYRANSHLFFFTFTKRFCTFVLNNLILRASFDLEFLASSNCRKLNQGSNHPCHADLQAAV